jgi:hypothetical protein
MPVKKEKGVERESEPPFDAREEGKRDGAGIRIAL